jgi:serine/threonine protein kinase
MDYEKTDFRKMFSSVLSSNLSEEHVITLLYNQICAIKFMHSANIIHRDLKPGNFLLNDSCGVKICDFGLSREMPYPNELDKNLNFV